MANPFQHIARLLQARRWRREAAASDAVELFSSAERPYSDHADTLFAIVAALLMVAGVACSYADFADASALTVFVCAAAVAVLVLQAIGPKKIGTRPTTVQWVAAAGLLFACVAVGVAFLPLSWGGFAGFVNAFVVRFNNIYSCYSPSLPSPSYAMPAVLLFMGISGVIVGLLCSFGLQARSRVLLPVFLLAQVILGRGFAVSDGFAGVILAFSGTLLYYYVQARARVRLHSVALGALIPLAIVLAVSGACAQYQPLQAVGQARSWIGAAVQAVRYGSDSLPLGKVAAAGAYADGEDEALELTASSRPANEVLLRGYVGCTWNGASWETIDDQAYTGTWEGMMPWLLSQGFDPQLQVALYNRLTADGNAPSSVSLDVQTKAATRAFVYAPYTLASSSQPYEQGHDAQLVSTRLLGAAGNELGYLDLSPERALSDEVQGLHDSDGQEQAAYADAEAVYRAFVEQHYLDLTDDERQQVNRLFFDQRTFDGDNPTLYSVVSRVRLMLSSLASYDAGYVGGWAQGGFLTQFLETEHRGSSSSFATAAVLAFRAQGIPARYAEGYRAEASGFRQQDGGYAATLSADDLHAWVEVYRDGLGWVPVEVTPGFYTPLTLGDSVIQVNRDSEGGSGDDQGQGAIAGDMPQDQQEDGGTDARLPLSLMVACGALLVIALLALAVLAALEAQRAVRRHLLARRRASDDQQLAIRALVDQVGLYARAAGVPFDASRPDDCAQALVAAFPQVWPEEYARVTQLLRKSAFSEAPLQAHEVRTLNHFSERLKRDVPEGNLKTTLFNRYRYLM